MILRRKRPQAGLLWTLLAFAGTASAQYGAGVELDVNATQLGRLGVEWARPANDTDVVIATGSAVVVVPPTQEAVVSTQVAGLVTRLFVAEGASVAAGEALLEISSPALLGLQREYLEAEATAALATAQLERDRGLKEDGIIADRRLNETAAAADAASLREEQARQQLALAGLDAAELAELRRTHRLAPALRLKAPLAGTLVTHHLSLGEQVEPFEPAARIADLGHLWLEVSLPQERADAIAPGMSIRVDARGEPLTATIFHVGRIVDSATQTVLIRGEIDNTAGILRGGQVLPARILDNSSSRASLTVPTSAIVRLDGNTHVFSRTSTGVLLVPVEIIGADDTRVFIGTGRLDPATEVAVTGVSTLKSMLMADESEEG
jgi:cobalt-zinc-cadmium efflux system membrane fusion protein